MRKLVLQTLAAGTLLTTCPLPGALAQKAPAAAKTVGAKAVTTTASAPLAALFAAYWEDQAKLYPLSATAQGDYRYNDQLPNYETRAFRQQLQQVYQQYLISLQKFDRTKLSAEDQANYDIFEYEMKTRLDGLKLNTWMMPFAQFYSLPNNLVQLGAGTGSQPFKTVKDYDDWLARVDKFPVWADSAIGNFRRGMKAGVVLPKVLVLKMVPQLQAQVVTDPAKSLFYGPITRLPASFSEADKTRLTAAYQQAIATVLVPTYRKLADFLQTEYLPAARSSTGIGAVPGGTEMYRFAVRQMTTTDRTPDAIYQTGLAEVKRIRAEMEAVKKQVGYEGDLPAFFNYLNSDPKFTPYKTPDDVLNAFRAIQARITPHLPKLFGRTPKSPFEIRQTEAFRAATASAEYNRGTPDGSRPGIFYVPILDATKFNVTSGMESLFLHEAIPGHHYQLSLQQENTTQPKFRRFASYSAFSEGWALYCESLGPELGLYTDPYQKLGALGDDMHRAVRLVVDVGMHAKGMSREEAIKYMMDNEPISEQGATAEIERYMSWPGQALSYKTGGLKLRELRARYEKQLGPKFDLRAFHDEILAGGSMPLAVLERRLDAWAARQR
ncbi:DUF885 domain-containing protein [Hymenobacter properus]|uniref:DUF885 domain-containing protein n=1 Tax=Hymenobacter properus TaxID=2791026 RepID=A0A931BEG0_9BACT|nr:DUF885 domain-containing protein [Hymenobacter properus]MBF9142314.1 DUF885 domain-containing protein [Hymenobacter properus]MBR7721121.1 DUF885 domain-containing protein [Microvirga sp. SRT04]